VKAIILAAGTGSRISALTGGRPKCLLSLHGRTILEWQLAALAACGIRDVTILVGHQADAIRAVAGTGVRYELYPHYARTNNLHTLQHCGHALTGDDVVVLFADVLIEQAALAGCVESAEDFALLVDPTQRLSDTMRVRLHDGVVADIGAHIPVDEADGNFVGIARFSEMAARLVRAELDGMVLDGGWERAYYTAALPRLAAKGESIRIVAVGPGRWREIDNDVDYGRAREERFYVTP
jgi:choline kinase